MSTAPSVTSAPADRPSAIVVRTVRAFAMTFIRCSPEASRPSTKPGIGWDHDLLTCGYRCSCRSRRMLAVVKDGPHHPPIFLERHRVRLDQLEPAVVTVHERDGIDAGEYIQQLKPCARREGQALFPKRSERGLASKGSRLIAVDGNDPGRAKLGFLRVV